MPSRGSAAYRPTRGAANSADWPRSAPPSTASRSRCQTAQPTHHRNSHQRDQRHHTRNRQTARHRTRRRIPDHHHRGRTTHTRRPNPTPDRRRAPPGHRRSPPRPRPLAGARRQLTRPGSMGPTGILWPPHETARVRSATSIDPRGQRILLRADTRRSRSASRRALGCDARVWRRAGRAVVEARPAFGFARDSGRRSAPHKHARRPA
jgi:hypothetical protein